MSTPTTVLPGFNPGSAGTNIFTLPSFPGVKSNLNGAPVTTNNFAGNAPSAAKFYDMVDTWSVIDPAYYQNFLAHYGIDPNGSAKSVKSAIEKLYDLGRVPALKGNLAAVQPAEVGYSTGTKDTATVGANGVLSQTLTANRIGSAYDTVQNAFDQWGLGNLMPWAQDQIFNHGATAQTILNELRYGKGPQHQEYENAFPGLTEHNATNGAGSEHLTEAQYQQLVQGYQGIGNQYGLPKGFLDKTTISNLIKGNVSAAEFQQRLTDGYVAAQNASPEAKALLQKYYGVGPAQMTAYWLNPTKALPLLQREIAAADIGGYAQQVGLNGLTQAQAQELASRARLGATAGNQGLAASTTGIENSLLSASKGAELQGSGAPGANLPGVDVKSLIGSQIAGFDGTNQLAAQEAVDKASSARAGIDQKGGGYDQTQKGVTGVGGATS